MSGVAARGALALTTRALRVDARSGGRAWQRTALALLLIAGLLWTREASRAGAPGQTLLRWVLFVDAAAIALLGIGPFAAVIAEETEQRTLGLLRLTGLGALPLLAGKSAAELGSAALLLALQLPFAVLAVTLGGVSAPQVLAAFVLLGAFLLGVYGVALLASVVCARARTAGERTAYVLVGMWLVPVLLAIDASGPPTPAWLDFLWSLCIWEQLYEATEARFDPARVRASAAAHLLLAALAAAAAWWAFERCHREEQPAALVRAQPTRLGGRLRRPRAGAAAVVWKDFHFMTGGHYRLATRIVFYALAWAVLIGPVAAGTAAVDMMTQVWIYTGWCGSALAAEVGWVAARSFGGEIAARTLPLLATLPSSLEATARHKGLACLRASLPGLLGLLLAIAVAAMRAPERTGLLLALGGMAVSGVVLVGHLAVYFAVVSARGAFARAVAGLLLWLLLILALAAGSRIAPTGEVFAATVAIATLVVAAGLHVTIGKRLLVAAGA